jgi:hypothetical protein
MCYTVLNMHYCTILCVYHTLPYLNILYICVVPHRTLLFKCHTVIIWCTVLCSAFTIGYITTLHCAALCWMWCRTILYCSLLFCMAPLCGIPHSAMHIPTVLLSVSYWFVVLLCTQLCCTVQYCSVLCQMADSVYSCDVLHYATLVL